MDWTYNGLPVEFDEIKENVGFVYLIENLDTGRKYIGKKLLWKPKRVTKKDPKTGKVRKDAKTGKPMMKLTKVESDWRDYFGSSAELLADVSALGADRFSRKILKLSKTKGQLSYDELQEQMDRRVLQSEGYYNGIIQVRIHRSHLDATDE